MGFALSAGLMTFIFAVEYFAQAQIRIEGHLEVTQPGNVLSVSLLYSLVKVVIVGICEELVFRGLVLRNLVEGFSGLGGLGVTTSKALALLLSALLFGAVHLTNPNSRFRKFCRDILHWHFLRSGLSRDGQTCGAHGTGDWRGTFSRGPSIWIPGKRR